MGTSTTLLTVQEFLALPEVEGERMELIGGEVVSMPLTGYPHEVAKANLIQILAVWLAQHPVGKAFSETGFQLAENTGIVPDVSVVFSARIVPGTRGIFQGAPDLAVEVVSSESAARLEEKIELYLAHGSKSVWVVYPEQQVVWVYDAAGARKFECSQKLEDSAVLPGFSAPVSEIFEGI